jgi:tetratricopeptide (TPR) repeat protein
MSVASGHFLHAKSLHLEGRLPEAESIYLQLLEQNPGDVECLHHLGLLHADTNRLDTGIQLIRVAIGIEGPKPWLCRNLGIVLERCGDRRGAIGCYRQALLETPTDHDLCVALATLLTLEERHAEAADIWRTAVESALWNSPEERRCRAALADALTLAGDRAAAIDQYTLLLTRDPDNVEALFHRAVAYMQESKREEAIAGFQRTLALDPGHARAANNLGVLEQLGRNYESAIGYYRAAIRRDPAYEAAIYNLGSAWQESNHAKNAICVYRKVLKRRPDHSAAWTNLGNAWLACNQTQTASDCYRKTLELTPSEPAAEWNLGISSLLRGELADGWNGYERRFEVKGATPRRPFSAPLWKGESLAGKSLLFHAEQGLGDTLQFIRYARLFAAQGAEVHVECQAALLPLLNGMEGVHQWHAAAGPGIDHLPPTDYQLPMLSAPAVVNTTLSSIPSPDGYLLAPERERRRWAKWLGARNRRRRVGICWAGNPNHKNDKNRSIPSDLLAALDGISEVDWINLQKGHPLPGSLELWNAARELRNFADTAGLIENLDLVVSVDTSVAHLAGALGKPVWVLLPFAPDWRWMLDRPDSPWYSGARLFRQSEPGDWRPVLDRVAHEVRATAQ